MSLSLVRLLQLASPLLPVGAYSYSQALEWAVERGWVHDAPTACAWIGDALKLNLARFEAPLLAFLLKAWSRGNLEEAARWNEVFLAGRETAELKEETLQMGYSLGELLKDLNAFDPKAIATLASVCPLSFPAAYSFAAVQWAIPAEAAITGYLWAWLENQVAAAIKLVPLGQAAGQRLLSGLGLSLPGVTEAALEADEDELHNLAPLLAIASSRHETQYTRLFRS